MYSQTVLDHFGNPRNVGRPAGTTSEGLTGDPSSGPFMRVFLRVEGNKVVSAGFETYGCVASIAAGSVLTSWITGRSVAEAAALSQSELVRMLGGLPLGKDHCAATAVSALQKALSSSVPY